ncbi:MAG: molybdopterin-dependent oxidoreductase, partial [Nitriliruptorales bacterium]|nr:molybdopterin-dependent oxidoreductase [Nitriliruptorales bacterium]
MTRTAIRTCNLCEATCGLRLTLEGDEVVRIEGDDDDVFSHGYLCPKGAVMGELDADPDRLRSPVIRTGESWSEVSWDEAFAHVADRLWPIIDEHGPNAVAVYLGNPNVHNLSGALYGKPFLKALRTQNIFTASTVDQMPKHVSSGLLFGDPLAIAVPDIDRTDHLLMLGANPHMSN